MALMLPLLPLYLATVEATISAPAAPVIVTLNEPDPLEPRARGALTGYALAENAAPTSESAGAQSAPADEAAPPPASDADAAAPPPASGADDAAPPPPASDADEALIDGRRRPGEIEKLPDPVRQTNPGAVGAPPPEAFPGDPDFPVPERWRLSQTLGTARKERFFDPYNQNTYKGDRPLCIPTEEEQERRAREGLPKCRTPKFLGLTGEDWFLALSATSDTVVEPRSFPIPVGVQTTNRPDSLDVFGRTNSLAAVQTFILGASLIKGSTAFRPPDVEYRVAVAVQGNFVDLSERRVLNVAPSNRARRFDHFVGLQELFVDYHIRNVSDRYDFDSVRVGIQPFQADFRGFLFNDQQLGIRLFGNRDGNRWQYNIAAFWRLDKDSNSGLNSVVDAPRDDWVIHANAYRQDFPVVGLTSQLSLTYNINRERDDVRIDDNGFPLIPALLGDLRGRNYDVGYLGYSVDGRIGRLNLTATTYGAIGRSSNNFFTSRPARIRSFFAAIEPSYDFNWTRVRLSGLYARGDGNPHNDTEGGFDAIFENPIFAGADTSYWIRQTLPFAGGGRVVSINGRNGVLNSLRSSKEQGQSNFNNPGTMLAGAGADFDLTPKLRLSVNANHLWFENTATLQALRTEGSIPKAIGWDLSAAAIYRPKAIQNVVLRLSGAVLEPGSGLRDLLSSATRDDRYYSILFNAILSF